MRALVTGAAGFIGANLVRSLAAGGHDVTAVYRPGSDMWRLDELPGPELLALDVCDRAAVRDAVLERKPQWVFHLAAHGAYSWQRDVDQIVATNLGSTIAVVEAAVEAGAVAIVNAGTSSEYGFQDHAPAEHETPAPNSDYAVAKAAATLYCGYAARELDAPTVTLRLYSVYGPWEEPRRLMPQLAVHGLRGELPPLVEPTIARDFVYIDDVMRAFVTAAATARRVQGEVFNIGTGTQTTVGELVDVARRLLEIDVEPKWGSLEQRDWDTSVWVANTDRARDVLGWRSAVGVEQGFEQTVAWLRELPETVAARYA